MVSTRLLASIAAFLLLMNCAGAYSVSGVDSLLTGYNVTAATLNSLVPVNVAYSGGTYAVLYSGTTPDFVVNVTPSSQSDYSVVLNATQIAAIITPTTLQNSFSSANLTGLVSMVKRYQSSSAGPISDCLNETGLSRGSTCTAANYCASCQLVPSCSKAMYSTDGPTGVLGSGIMAFESSYGQLNSSFNTLYSQSSANASGFGSALARIGAAFSNISSISSTIYQNALFPPTANITNQQLQQCSFYTAPTSGYTSNVAAGNGAPWYCNAIGFCQFLSYNNTLLNQIQSRINTLNALPVTNSQILSIATTTSNFESAFVVPKITVQRTAQLNTILNTTLASYPGLINSTQLLLTHVANASLSSQLAAIKGSYSNFVSNFLTENLTKSSASVATSLRSLQSSYNSANATYSSLVNTAALTTSMIIKAQLDTNSNPPSLAQLAYSQLGLNNQLGGQIGNTTLLARKLSAANSQASAIYYSSKPVFSLTEFTRAIDMPFITALAPAMNLPYASAVAIAPALGVISSIVGGIILLIIVGAYYSHLKSKRKLLVSPRSRRGWMIVFAAIVVLILLDAGLNYVYASAASTNVPSTAFISAVGSSQSVAIAINGTATANETLCASQIASKVTAMHKKPISVAISSAQCTAQNITSTVGSCLDRYARLGTPMVMLTNSATDSISIYSLYGTVMYASGDSAFMGSCYPAQLLK